MGILLKWRNSQIAQTLTRAVTGLSPRTMRRKGKYPKEVRAKIIRLYADEGIENRTEIAERVDKSISHVSETITGYEDGRWRHPDAEDPIYLNDEQKALTGEALMRAARSKSGEERQELFKIAEMVFGQSVAERGLSDDD